jgi:hypothetical protein
MSAAVHFLPSHRPASLFQDKDLEQKFSHTGSSRREIGMRLFDRLPGRRRVVAVQQKLLETIVTSLADAATDDAETASKPKSGSCCSCCSAEAEVRKS